MALQWRPSQRDLGCAVTHSVHVMDRGGATKVGVLTDIAQLQWSRKRDAVSDATIRIAMDDCSSQRDLLSQIEPKRSEIVIYRGVDRVWEGPVWRTTDHPDYFEIYAKDVFAYLEGTPLTRVWDNTFPNNVEMTTRIGQMIEYELSTNYTIRSEGGGLVPVTAWENLPTPVNLLPYLTIHHFPNEAKTSDRTSPYEMTVGQYIQLKARTGGIDYTAVGRAIHVWDTSRWIGQTRPLTDADFDGKPIVSAYGSDHTTFAYVATEDNRYGSAGVPDDYYGPWSKIFTVYNEESTKPPTDGDLNSQASRNVAGRTPVPVEVRIPDNSTIRLDSSLTINDLVPGVRVPLVARMNVRSINQPQKLQSMVVTEDGSGETVQVTLTPATRPDSDDEG